MKNEYNEEKTIRIVTFLILLVFLFSCSQKRDTKTILENTPDIHETVLNEETSSLDESSKVSVESTMSGSISDVPTMIIENNRFTNYITSRAASVANQDKSHRLIRSAQTKFRVEFISQATLAIENIALKNGGLILNSSISNNQSYFKTTNISEDSALIVHYSNLVATIQLKVPQQILDTVLHQIAPLAVEIDYRTIQAHDVTLQMMRDSLIQERIDKKKNRIRNAINSKGSQLKDVMNAEEALDNSLEQVDETILSTFSLNEQIEFSLIDINLYQNQVKFTEKVLREESIIEHKPSLMYQATDSLKNGWFGLSMILIFLLNIWPLLIVIVVIVLFYMRYNKQKRG